MNQQDVYKTPESDLGSDNLNNDEHLASRMQRLAACFIDGLTMAAVTLPLVHFTGGFEGVMDGVQPAFTYSVTIAAAGITFFALINWNLLKRSGQTIGKKLVGIKIATMEDELPAGKAFVKRYAVYFLPGRVPVVGSLFSLVNILFIFGKSRRCVHDHVAGTKVVTCGSH